MTSAENWLFVGALTNAEAHVRVVQAETGLSHDWHNPAGVFPEALARVPAFPCLPGG